MKLLNTLTLQQIHICWWLYLCTMCRRSKRILGEHGGGGVVARAKVQTVKVKSLSLLFSYVDVVFIPDTTCGEGVKFFSMVSTNQELRCFWYFFGVRNPAFVCFLVSNFELKMVLVSTKWQCLFCQGEITLFAFLLCGPYFALSVKEN